MASCHTSTCRGAGRTLADMASWVQPGLSSGVWLGIFTTGTHWHRHVALEAIPKPLPPLASIRCDAGYMTATLTSTTRPLCASPSLPYPWQPHQYLHPRSCEPYWRALAAHHLHGLAGCAPSQLITFMARQAVRPRSSSPSWPSRLCALAAHHLHGPAGCAPPEVEHRVVEARCHRINCSLHIPRQPNQGHTGWVSVPSLPGIDPGCPGAL